MDMDNYRPQGTMHVRAGHEEADFSLRGIILFVVILVLSAILTFFAASGLMSLFEWGEKKYIDKKPTPAQQVLNDQRSGEIGVKKEGLKPPPEWYARAVDEKVIERTFAAPRLQYDDTADMNYFLDLEKKRLENVGKYRDGRIHIPIDRAIDLLAQRGLPQVNGTFTPGPPLGELTAVANAAQQRVNEAAGRTQQPGNRKK